MLAQVACCVFLSLAGRSLTLPMASEEAANPGAQPAAPAAPTIQKKSQKKGKEKPEAREDAQEGGDEVMGQAAEIKGLTRAGRRVLVLGDAQETVGCFRKALLLSRGTASPQLRRACAFSLGAAYVETGKPKRGLEFLLQSQPSERESREHLRDLYFNIGAAHEGLWDFPKALEYFDKAISHDHAVQAGSRAGPAYRWAAATWGCGSQPEPCVAFWMPHGPMWWLQAPRLPWWL